MDNIINYRQLALFKNIIHFSFIILLYILLWCILALLLKTHPCLILSFSYERLPICSLCISFQQYILMVYFYYPFYVWRKLWVGIFCFVHLVFDLPFFSFHSVADIWSRLFSLYESLKASTFRLLFTCALI